ncbi:uncharacterized protein LOC124678497 [Lolium rigidum]|uniref:uncharacterized protein LOC124678497 n=1 Tax=Lolium rigidum TaxID=89674 RepID=UPI001F5CEE8A|nr:uncharacterized protein LOC124678497 [Lolium rigidum]XP_051216438.1 uncharacterized protein LOC127334061 [Lolium perenne]
MSCCLRRAAVPVKRVWLGLRWRLRRRRSGLGELTREVRTCEYDDVHVMWGLLSGMDGSAPRKYVYVPVPEDSGALAAAAASTGAKRRRKRRADAESAAWSRLFSSCCAF